MNIDESKLKPEDFGEPYSSLVYRIGIANTIKFATRFSGRQIGFKKWEIKKGKYYKEIELLMGEENAVKISKLYSGLTIYFPEIKTACKKKIRELINAEFNGYNRLELAKKYGYSERHIYRITDGNNKKENITFENQLTLFDKL